MWHLYLRFCSNTWASECWGMLHYTPPLFKFSAGWGRVNTCNWYARDVTKNKHIISYRWAAADFVSGQTSIIFSWVLLLLHQHPFGRLLFGLSGPQRATSPGEPHTHYSPFWFSFSLASLIFTIYFFIFLPGGSKLFKVLWAVGRRKR